MKRELVKKLMVWVAAQFLAWASRLVPEFRQYVMISWLLNQQEPELPSDGKQYRIRWAVRADVIAEKGSKGSNITLHEMKARFQTMELLGNNKHTKRK